MSDICIFYDLETTDKSPIGQIINLSFIVTDLEFKVLEEFNREIRISRLQLPSAGAILANRTNVIQHQERVRLSEREGLFELWKFLNDKIEKNKSVTIVGFNNLGFDQNYLRTSFIRNGLNPYYPKKVIEGDLFVLTQYLSITDPKFPRPKSSKPRKDGTEKISLSLENLTKAFGLLDGPQTHNSRDDVLLTIELAKVYKQNFNRSIVGFNSYQAGAFHKDRSNDQVRGAVINRKDAVYEIGEKICVECPYLFLDSDYRYSLWVDLDSFEKGYKSLRLVKINSTPFFTDGKEILTDKIMELKKSALEKYGKVRLSSYFTKAECDIEQFIYRVDFQNIEALNKAIWQGNADGLSSDDAKRILGRYRLANFERNGKQDDIFEKRLKDYALYRYGGQLRMDKGRDLEDGILNREVRVQVHPTFSKQMSEIDGAVKLATEAGRSHDVELLEALKKFYLESEIYRIAGADLEKIGADVAAETVAG